MAPLKSNVRALCHHTAAKPWLTGLNIGAPTTLIHMNAPITSSALTRKESYTASSSTMAVRPPFPLISALGAERSSKELKGESL
jgi:hypothetical protein